MLNTFKIYNQQKELVGSVTARSIGEAVNKAISQKMIAGRKQVSKVEEIEYDDPYEQTFEDIYGS
jgi:uncharacterized protein YydD (DUF2326 family)